MRANRFKAIARPPEHKIEAIQRFDFADVMNSPHS